MEIACITPYNEFPSPEKATRAVFNGYHWDSKDWDIYTNNICNLAEESFNMADNPAADVYPRLNTDASWVVFVSDRDGNDEIYKVRIDGQELTRLTYHNAVDTRPAFSPDGTQVTFASDRTGNADIFLMDSDGLNVRPLTTSTLFDVEPEWSPDGKKIAWIRRSGNIGYLYVMNADGTGGEQQIAAFLFGGNPTWSPDGKLLAVEHDADGDGWLEISTLNVDGTGLTDMPGIDYAYTSDYTLGSFYGNSGGYGLSYVRLDYVYSDKHKQWFVYQTYMLYQGLGDSIFDGAIHSSLDENFYLYFYPHTRTWDVTPPQTSMQALPRFSQREFDISFSAKDDLSPSLVSIEVREGLNGSWQKTYQTIDPIPPSEWYNGTYYHYRYEGEAGTTLYFRVTATDMGGNASALDSTYQASTQIYEFHAQALVQDNRGIPLSDAVVNGGPDVMNQPEETGAGIYDLYYRATGNQEASVSKPGFGLLPIPIWPVGTESEFLTILPPQQNLLTNSFFEDPTDALTGWDTTGSSFPVQSSSGRYGGNAARLGVDCGVDLCSDGPGKQALLSQTVTIPTDLHQPTLSFLYKLWQRSTLPNNLMSVILTPQGGDPVTLMEVEAPPGDTPAVWKHAWVDLSPWKGQEVNIMFHLKVIPEDGGQLLYLDEITLGAWTTPMIDTITPTQVEYPVGAGEWVEITGTNLLESLQIYVGDTPSPEMELTQSLSIRFRVPPGLAMGRYALWVENPGGVTAQARQPLTIGHIVFLPRLGK